MVEFSRARRAWFCFVAMGVTAFALLDRDQRQTFSNAGWPSWVQTTLILTLGSFVFLRALLPFGRLAWPSYLSMIAALLVLISLEESGLGPGFTITCLAILGCCLVLEAFMFVRWRKGSRG